MTYQFKIKPAAKSSTSVLTSTPGAIACPKCGCRSLGIKREYADRPAIKKDCKCTCHEEVI